MFNDATNFHHLLYPLLWLNYFICTYCVFNRLQTFWRQKWCIFTFIWPQEFSDKNVENKWNNNSDNKKVFFSLPSCLCLYFEHIFTVPQHSSLNIFSGFQKPQSKSGCSWVSQLHLNPKWERLARVAKTPAQVFASLSLWKEESFLQETIFLTFVQPAALKNFP